MEKDEQIDKMAQKLANFAIDYAGDNGLTNGDVMNVLGRLYVTYAFTVRSDKITSEELSKSLVGFVDAACNLMVEVLRHDKKA